MFEYENDFEAAKNEVAYTYETVSFFRKHMDEAHLSPKDINTPYDFCKIPSTEKRHYRKNFPVEVLANGFTLNDQRLSRFPSAGTTTLTSMPSLMAWIWRSGSTRSVQKRPSCSTVRN